MDEPRFTGLVDKHGTKLYEGDTVIKCWGGRTTDIDGERVWVEDIREHVITFWQEGNQMAWLLGEGCFNIWNSGDVELKE